MVDFFSAVSSALPSTTRVLAFRGTEAISALYRFEIYLFIEDPGFDMAAALGADAVLSVNREDGESGVYHGILASIETVGDLARGAIYRAVLVPRSWRMTLDHHSRVFVDESAPGILETVLHDAGFEVEDYTLKLSGSYPRLPHVCQYRESAFAFLSRRMEREGIYYFFEQGESRERLVITDDRWFHQALSNDSVRYFRASGAGVTGANGLRSFTCKHSSIVGSVRVKDHDYLRPALDVSGQATVSGGAEEMYLHGENAVTPEDGQRLARIRSEELKARQVVFRGAGRVFFLRPGYTFALEDHPRQGVDGEYLATELEHRGNALGGLAEAKELLGLEGEEDDVYHVDVVAIPRSIQFRPKQQSPVPRIYGTERAIVDGEADHDYAQLDEHGRYLVKIHFDESALTNGKASTRIRMMQPHGGNPESFHFPLRKGTEVLLTFEGGDPDRPVIAGVVPTLVSPAEVTSRNATRNIIQTGGRNRVQIEDKEGKQHVRLSSPHLNTFLHLGAPNGDHNWIGNTDGNTYMITGQDSETGVGGSRLTVIGDAQGTYTNSTSSTPQAGTPMDSQLLGEALALAGKTKTDSAGNTTVSTGAPVAEGTVTVTETGSGTPTATITVPPAGGAGSTPGGVTGAGGSSGATINFSDAATSSPFTLNLNPTPTSAVPAMGTTPAKIATGILEDPDSRTSYRAGSDIKLLSGDNVTKTEYDNISATHGNSVSHTHGQAVSFVGIGLGPNSWAAPAPPAAIDETTQLPAPGTPIQQSTVLGGVSSTVFAPNRLTSTSTVVTPPLPSVPIDGSEAKRAVLFGDQLSWVDGNVNGTITGSKTTTVDRGASSTVYAPSPPSGPQPPTSLPDANTAQSSVLYGNQLSWVNGNQDSTITGDRSTTVNGSSTSTINGSSTSTINGGQLSAVFPAHLTIDIYKCAIYLSQLSLGVSKISYSVFSSTQSQLYLKNNAVDISTHMNAVVGSLLYLIT